MENPSLSQEIILFHEVGRQSLESHLQIYINICHIILTRRSPSLKTYGLTIPYVHSQFSDLPPKFLHHVQTLHLLESNGLISCLKVKMTLNSTFGFGREVALTSSTIIQPPSNCCGGSLLNADVDLFILLIFHFKQESSTNLTFMTMLIQWYLIECFKLGSLLFTQALLGQ